MFRAGTVSDVHGVVTQHHMSKWISSWQCRNVSASASLFPRTSYLAAMPHCASNVIPFQQRSFLSRGHAAMPQRVIVSFFFRAAMPQRVIVRIFSIAAMTRVPPKPFWLHIPLAIELSGGVGMTSSSSSGPVPPWSRTSSSAPVPPWRCKRQRLEEPMVFPPMPF